VAAQPYPPQFFNPAPPAPGIAGRSMSTVQLSPNANAAIWWSTPTPVGQPGSGEPATLLGDDLVTTDVLSFEIKVLRPNDVIFRDLNDWFPDGATPPVFAQRYMGIYDTAIGNQSFLSLRAIKITIRVWDFKTQLARQITVIQDL
jgi:hypothetical protein